MNERADLLIVGGGLVGASLALALDAAGRSVTLVEAMAPRAGGAAGDDDRNLVLARASVNALRSLGVWPRLEAAAGTIRHLEVSRAGEFGRVRMSAEDAGVDALGRVVPGRVLASALEARLAEARHVQRLVPAALESLTPTDSGWLARIATGGEVREIEAGLVVGADGSASMVRRQVGIEAHEHDYWQSLFVCTVSCGHDLPDRAFERFTDDGPVALLPLPNRRRGLVLTVDASRHDEVAAMDDAVFLAMAQQRFGWKLGAFSRPGRRFPHRIRRVVAQALTARRAVLVGNAAQTVHPIGAQGFNLGLRDALVLAETVGAADDPGAPDLLADYAARRQPDREGVLAFSHGLVSLACLAQPALAPLRSLAMVAFDRLPPLRHAMARRGMGFRGRPPAAVLDTAP
ncbi:MAG TPA: 2-octaprenyl-6-methoxyphenyl hydroxylase [Rhodanobacteraceae bacterium]|jgi:2-octaprenyl-6-methoxyphenol hydroxylase|nr:2-octaprenyl-6-methoxyphenyl hydroxylase [Rhodanobacteraceae bacterium]